MLKTELLQIIANGENSGVEFKRDDLRPEQLAKEIVAMANLRGGMLLLGVEDDGSISGIRRDDLETWAMDTVFGRFVHPTILPFYEIVACDDGKRVAVITIASGTAKPYVLRHNDREDIYIRIGSISRLATREQQASLFQSGSLLHAELLPVSGTSLNVLDMDRLKEYLISIVGMGNDLPASDEEWFRRLDALGFMTTDPNGVALCTIAGTLLFARTPHRFLPQAGIRWIAFEGQDKTYRALDDIYLDAPLTPLRDPVSRTLLQGGLIENLLDRIQPFASMEAEHLLDNLRRERHWFFPPEALRETFVNALAHRDWTRPREMEAILYSNRMDVTSPGSLPNSMTVEKMLAGQRSPRNPVIISVLRDYGYLDARGMGVRTKIVPLVRKAGGTEPIFEATEDFLRVELPKSR